MYLLFMCFALAAGDVLPLDESRPGLSSGGAAVDWTSGGGAFTAASARIVRVNYRGIFTDTGTIRDLRGLGWTAAPCNASAHALCRAEAGAIFPARPEAAGGASGLPPGWGGLGCGNAAGRTIVPWVQYDVSACDVLDEGLDVVYSASTVYFVRDALAPWRYWTLIAGAVLLVRGLAKNVERVRREADAADRVDQLLPMGAAAACIVAASLDGTGVYATDEDLVFFLATLAYSGAYLAFHVAALRWDTTPPVFNLSAGVLQLIVSRLYAGAESPYNPVILLILSTRAFTKLAAPSPAHAVTGLMDACYIALGCELGFLPDPSYLAPLFVGASLASRIYFET